MALTTANIVTRVMNSLRLPETNTVQYTRVLDLVNEVYRDILAKYTWYWLVKRGVFNTTAKIDVGTIDVRQGDSQATRSTVTTASLAGYKLVVSANSDDPAVYRIAASAASYSTFSLDAAYTGPTAASTSYTLYQDEYSLATDVGRVLFMQRYGFPEKLHLLNPEEVRQSKGVDTSEGAPQAAALWEFATTGDPSTARRVTLVPYPDQPYRIEYWYKQKGTELASTSSSIPMIPDEYAQVLVYGALSRAYPVLLNDTERGTYYLGLFNEILNLMVAQQREYEGQPSIVPRDTHRQFYTRGRRTAANSDLGAYFDRLPYNP